MTVSVRSPVAILLAVAALLAAADVAPVCAQTAPAGADTTRVIDREQAWERVSEARDAAGAERHEEAARTYLEALASDARLVPTVAHELAYQKLWREDAEKAIFYFRRYLARHPDQPNRDVRAGLALAYSWSGRQGEAIALYRELVQEDPTDAGARLGLGRSLIWDNRLHEGARELYALESDRTVSAAGRREATRFLLTVLDEYDPTLDLRWSGIRDSDDLSIQRLSARARTHWRNVLLEARAGHAWYTQPDSNTVTAPRAGLGLVASLAHDWQLHAYAWVDRFASDGPVGQARPELDWTTVGADAWLTWLATDRLRLDLGAARQPMESLQALGKELRLDLVSLSADWRPGRAWTLSGAVQQGDLTDGNRRRRGSVGLTWRREGRLELRLGPSLTYMDHERPYPGGYWAPDWVRNVGLDARVARRWGRVSMHVAGRLGQEKELGADAITVGSVSGHLGWRFARRWHAIAEVGTSRSRFDSATGYRRTTASLAVRALF